MDRIALLVAFALMTGCAPSSYRLGRDALVPPGVKRSSVGMGKLEIRPVGPSCEAGGGEQGVRAALKGGTLRLEVERGRLSLAPAGWASGWAARLEGRGCVPAGQGSAVADRLVTSVALPAMVAYRLTHADTAATGYLDLRPGYRLRMTSPIMRAGAGPQASAIEQVRESAGGLTVDVKSSADLLGYEVAWYDVTATGLRAAGAEAHIDGKVEKSPSSRFDRFHFPASAPLLRSLVLTRQSSQDRDSLLLAAARESELEAQTAAMNQDPSQCRGERCVVLPRQVALTAFIVINANGEDRTLAPGATVRQATGGKLPLRFWKPYAGRLAPVVLAGGDVLAMPLAGGERLEF